jgi:septal ring-binding cell division protein DamX
MVFSCSYFFRISLIRSGCSQLQIHVKQLAVTAYQQWDQLEEVVNETALSAYEGLVQPFPQEKPSSSCTPVSNESMISSGSQNAEYLDNVESRTATSNAVMSTNSSNTLDSAAAILPAGDGMYWIPSMAGDDDHFTWNNSTNLGCWDQVD